MVTAAGTFMWQRTCVMEERAVYWNVTACCLPLNSVTTPRTWALSVVRMCVCVWEREREREKLIVSICKTRLTHNVMHYMYVNVYNWLQRASCKILSPQPPYPPTLPNHVIPTSLWREWLDLSCFWWLYVSSSVAVLATSTGRKRKRRVREPGPHPLIETVGNSPQSKQTCPC